MSYLIAKHLHMTLAVISGGLFAARWTLSCLQSRWLSAHWLRVLPHVIDSLLLAAAIYLCIQLQQYPLFQPWLTAKVFALLLYIGLGIVAIRLGKRPATRFLAGGLALLVLGYIFGVAHTHSPFPWAS
jgi:uncharacterized membrane protein SirB2